MGKMIDNYMLRQCIGEGSFGKVYKATHSKKEGDFAVKIIPVQKFHQNAKLQQCTFNEVKILSTIGLSNNIVRYYQMLKTKNNYYFIYEYCNGGTLLDKIKKDGPIPQKKATQYFKQLLEAFKVLNHLKIMHRDIKAQNIFFHNDCLKLGDFGFCKGLGPQENLAKTMLGSPIYMAPQVLKGQPYTTKADIWSLGVIFYEMLYGKCPFQSHSIAMLINTISSTQVQFPYQINVTQVTQNLIRKMLTKDYYRRIGWIQLFNLNHMQEQEEIEKESQKKYQGRQQSLQRNQNYSNTQMTQHFSNKSPQKSYGNFRSQLSGSLDMADSDNNNFRFGDKNKIKGAGSVPKNALQSSNGNLQTNFISNVNKNSQGSNGKTEQKKVFYSQRYLDLMNSMNKKPIEEVSSPIFNQQKNINNKSFEEGIKYQNHKQNQDFQQEKQETSILKPLNGISPSVSPVTRHTKGVGSVHGSSQKNDINMNINGINSVNDNRNANSASKIKTLNERFSSSNSKQNISHILDTSVGTSLNYQVKEQAAQQEDHKSNKKIEYVRQQPYERTASPNKQQNPSSIKRRMLLKTHQNAVSLLRQSIAALEKRQIEAISKAYGILLKVKQNLKQITSDIQITEVNLLDLSSLINYEVIQVDRLIVQVKQEMMKLKIQIPNGNSSKGIYGTSLNGFSEQENGRRYAGYGSIIKVQ